MNLIEFLQSEPNEIFKCFIEKASDLGLQFTYKNNYYLYIKGNCNIALTSHVDTVYINDIDSDKMGIQIKDKRVFLEKNGLITATRNGNREVLGGDDRVGVHICYEQLSKTSGDIPHILLFNGEEVGGIGSDCFCNDKVDLSEIDLMISLDACYNNEYVYYGTNRTADAWVNSFGWKNKGAGIYTDIKTLGNYYDFCCVNLGVGYFNQHTEREYIDIEIMEMAKRKLNRMIETGYIPEQKKLL